MRRGFVLLIVFALFMVVFAPPAAAGPRERVTITVDTDIAAVAGPFTASGPVCGSGMANGVYLGEARDFGSLALFKIDFTFDCDDDSGEFVIRLNVVLNRNTGRTFALWRVVGGTEAYDGLRGFGYLIGTPGEPGFIQDVYTGVMRIR
jgi:hypothetical protein